MPPLSDLKSKSSWSQREREQGFVCYSMQSGSCPNGMWVALSYQHKGKSDKVMSAHQPKTLKTMCWLGNCEVKKKKYREREIRCCRLLVSFMMKLMFRVAQQRGCFLLDKLICPKESKSAHSSLSLKFSFQTKEKAIGHCSLWWWSLEQTKTNERLAITVKRAIRAFSSCGAKD